MTNRLMLRLILAIAAPIATAIVSLPPTSVASKPLQLAMHDMMEMPMQAPGTQQGSMGGMRGGGHGGMSGPMQQQGPAGHAPPWQGMQPGMSMGAGQVDMTERLEGRIAFLRAELHITDAQAVAWNSFADALRSARKHLIEARHALMQTTPSARLEQYERHLKERLQALSGARTAFEHLYALLDAAQKRTADELVIPYVATF